MHGYYLWWESLSKAQKAAYKAPKRQQHIDEWMELKPPSEKQLSLIASKGYRGEPPANMWEASRIIGKLLKKGA
jgi:hypothetical protein